VKDKQNQTVSRGFYRTKAVITRDHFSKMSRSTYNVDALLSHLPGYRDAPRVRDDVSGVLSQVGTLVPQVGRLVRNTGAESQLLTLVGTVAIYYRGTRYNIPVEAYLPENYPSTPPTVYVRPTHDMDIKKAHRHVDESGLVYMPYLHEWTPRRGNLVEMCAALSSIFGQDPPVYARPPSQQPVVRGQVLTPVQKPSPPADPREVSKTELTKKLQGELQALYNELRADIDREFETQTSLQAKGGELGAQCDVLSTHVANLQRLTVAVGEKAGLVDQALRDRESSKALAPKPADLVEPLDILSQQVLNLTAENASIDDTLYYLDRGIAAGRIDLDTFLREVGRLARRQFECRALVDKIRGIQAQKNQAETTRHTFELQTRQHAEMQMQYNNQQWVMQQQAASGTAVVYATSSVRR
jgi:ESCRT-I complex subunit TSG101